MSSLKANPDSDKHARHQRPALLKSLVALDISLTPDRVRSRRSRTSPAEPPRPPPVKGAARPRADVRLQPVSAGHRRSQRRPLVGLQACQRRSTRSPESHHQLAACDAAGNVMRRIVCPLLMLFHRASDQIGQAPARPGIACPAPWVPRVSSQSVPGQAQRRLRRDESCTVTPSTPVDRRALAVPAAPSRPARPPDPELSSIVSTASTGKGPS